MQHTRSRKLKTLVAAVAAAALTAPVTQAALQTDARHQALLDKAPQVQVDPHHQILLMHRHAGELNYVSVPPSTASAGTDWGDAGIGAAALFSVGLLGAGGALVGRKKVARA